MGLSLDDLEQLDTGFVLDMAAESANDGVKYKEVATQSDYNNF